MHQGLEIILRSWPGHLVSEGHPGGTWWRGTWWRGPGPGLRGLTAGVPCRRGGICISERVLAGKMTSAVTWEWSVMDLKALMRLAWGWRKQEGALGPASRTGWPASLPGQAVRSAKSGALTHQPQRPRASQYSNAMLSISDCVSTAPVTL